ncbi:hypothetical protein D3C87_1896180 [compost metagenome]
MLDKATHAGGELGHVWMRPDVAGSSVAPLLGKEGQQAVGIAGVETVHDEFGFFNAQRKARILEETLRGRGELWVP